MKSIQKIYYELNRQQSNNQQIQLYNPTNDQNVVVNPFFVNEPIYFVELVDGMTSIDVYILQSQLEKLQNAQTHLQNINLNNNVNINSNKISNNNDNNNNLNNHQMEEENIEQWYQSRILNTIRNVYQSNQIIGYNVLEMNENDLDQSRISFKSLTDVDKNILNIYDQRITVKKETPLKAINNIQMSLQFYDEQKQQLFNNVINSLKNKECYIEGSRDEFAHFLIDFIMLLRGLKIMGCFTIICESNSFASYRNIFEKEKQLLKAYINKEEARFLSSNSVESKGLKETIYSTDKYPYPDIILIEYSPSNKYAWLTNCDVVVCVGNFIHPLNPLTGTIFFNYPLNQKGQTNHQIQPIQLSQNENIHKTIIIPLNTIQQKLIEILIQRKHICDKNEMINHIHTLMNIPNLSQLFSYKEKSPLQHFIQMVFQYFAQMRICLICKDTQSLLSMTQSMGIPIYHENNEPTLPNEINEIVTQFNNKYFNYIGISTNIKKSIVLKNVQLIVCIDIDEESIENFFKKKCELDSNICCLHLFVEHSKPMKELISKQRIPNDQYINNLNLSSEYQYQCNSEYHLIPFFNIIQTDLCLFNCGKIMKTFVNANKTETNNCFKMSKFIEELNKCETSENDSIEKEIQRFTNTYPVPHQSTLDFNKQINSFFETNPIVNTIPKPKEIIQQNNSEPSKNNFNDNNNNLNNNDTNQMIIESTQNKQITPIDQSTNSNKNVIEKEQNNQKDNHDENNQNQPQINTLTLMKTLPIEQPEETQQPIITNTIIPLLNQNEIEKSNKMEEIQPNENHQQENIQSKEIQCEEIVNQKMIEENIEIIPKENDQINKQTHQNEIIDESKQMQCEEQNEEIQNEKEQTTTTSTIIEPLTPSQLQTKINDLNEEKETPTKQIRQPKELQKESPKKSDLERKLSKQKDEQNDNENNNSDRMKEENNNIESIIILSSDDEEEQISTKEKTSTSSKRSKTSRSTKNKKSSKKSKQKQSKKQNKEEKMNLSEESEETKQIKEESQQEIPKENNQENQTPEVFEIISSDESQQINRENISNTSIEKTLEQFISQIIQTKQQNQLNEKDQEIKTSEEYAQIFYQSALQFGTVSLLQKYQSHELKDLNIFTLEECQSIIQQLIKTLKEKDHHQYITISLLNKINHIFKTISNGTIEDWNWNTNSKWTLSMDLTLFRIIVQMGMKNNEEYLNDIVLVYSLESAGMKTNEEKLQAITSRINELKSYIMKDIE